MTEFYETSYANVHRAVHVLGERATAGLEGARDKVAAFLNARESREIIFVAMLTEGLNLVAYSWGLNNLGPARRGRHGSFSITRSSSPSSTSRAARERSS